MPFASPMNRRESGANFKRIFSHNMAGSGNSGSNDATEFNNTKKLAKLKTQNGQYSGLGNSYLLDADHQPLLHQEPNCNFSHMSGCEQSQRLVPSNKGATDRHLETPQCHYLYGRSLSVGVRQEIPKGIRSVTDIEVTMDNNAYRGSPVSSVEESRMRRTHNKYYPVQQCTEVSCDEKSCLWHLFILKYPHLVKWEDRTVTVELKKNQSESFGFFHKAKQCRGTDEIFLLVYKVEMGSFAAQSGLAVGDLILSMNAIPVQEIQKMSEIIRNSHELRLQIQHPMEIPNKAAERVKQLAISMEENKQASANLAMKLSQPVSPSTSPSDSSFSPSSPFKENIPLFPIPRPEVKNRIVYHKLPQVRVFVCGNTTNEFVKRLFGDYINVPLDAKSCCFKISMRKSQDGTVSFVNSESFTYLFKNSPQSCINVELVAVSEDNFFHHCCTWMFTPNSLFLLAFDASQLLVSPEVEMSRLCSLADTICTGLHGRYPNLRIYGLMDDSGQSEEAQTLFYTNLGETLPDPKFIPVGLDVLYEEMKKIRLEIFETIASICGRQQVIYQTAIALDVLVSHRTLTITCQELIDKIEESNSGSVEVGQDLLYQMVDDLTNSGNLIVGGSMNASCRSNYVKEFVLPSMLFDHLSQLAWYMEKDRFSTRQQELWFTLSTSGSTTRSEMLEALNTCVSEPEKLLLCMEDFHLVFPVRVANQDSGFGEVSSVLFPYILEDNHFDPDTQRNYEKYVTLEFSENIPSSSFFCLVSELSQTDECLSFAMCAQYVCQMNLQGQECFMCFVKAKKQVQIYLHRTSCTRGNGKSLIEHKILQVLRQQIPSSVHVIIVHAAESQLPSIGEVSSPGASVLERQGADPSNLLRLVEEMKEGARALPEENAVSEAEAAQLRVLRLRMMDLRFIQGELHDICRYLSIEGAWETLAEHLGLTLAELGIHTSMLALSPNRLPAKTFLMNYFKESNCTVGEFLQAFLKMAENNTRYQELAENLWTATLLKNSPYYERQFQPF